MSSKGLRGGDGSTVVRSQKLKRQLAALEMRRRGLGLEEIAQRMGYSKTQAFRDVNAGLEDARAQVRAAAEEVRVEEISRLDALLFTLWPRARRGELKVIDRVLKVCERRAYLLGLDAPMKVDETVRAALVSEVKHDLSALSLEDLEHLHRITETLEAPGLVREVPSVTVIPATEPAQAAQEQQVLQVQ